jgi:hypothetical protein
MQYWEIVTHSFQIAWRYKYLWLLASFSGEAGGGFNFSTGNTGPVPNTAGGGSPDFNGAMNQVTTWINANIGAIALLGALSFVLVVVLFVLAAVCEGALVRAAAEHDAERSFGLRTAWSSGRYTMSVIIRFRLILIGLWLPVAIAFIAIVGGAVFAFTTNNVGAGIALTGVGLLLLLATIPYAIYLFLLDRVGSRAVILEQLQARAALGRAHGLIRRRLGRVLLLWLVSIVVGIAVGLAFGCVFALAFLPVVIVTVVAKSAVGLVLVILVGLVIAFPVAGFLGAQSSTFWTLAFRRLDLDPVPAYGYPYAPAPPQTTPSA